MPFRAVAKLNRYVGLVVWAAMAMRRPIGTPLERGWCRAFFVPLSSH